MEEIIISKGEAREFAEFKRQKRVQEVCRLLKRVECDLTGVRLEEVKEAVKACKKGGFTHVRVSPLQLKMIREISSPLVVVCLAEEVNSDLKTKMTAIRQAYKNGADEIVMTLSEQKNVKSEIKKLKRVARGRRIFFRLQRVEGLEGVLKGLSLVAREEDFSSAKFLGGDTLTVELLSKDLKGVIERGADRVATSDYEAIASALFQEANREELFERIDE